MVDGALLYADGPMWVGLCRAGNRLSAFRAIYWLQCAAKCCIWFIPGGWLDDECRKCRLVRVAVVVEAMMDTRAENGLDRIDVLNGCLRLSGVFVGE